MTFVMAEGASGVWVYHVRQVGAENALCGTLTFDKDLPLAGWGHRSHIREGYCSRCEAEAKRLNVPLGPGGRP